jgi:hypothetical protein
MMTGLIVLYFVLCAVAVVEVIRAPLREDWD